MAKITLRPATEADIAVIAAIQTAAFWSIFEQLEPGSRDHPGYLTLATSKSHRYAEAEWPSTTIAEVNGHASGVCTLEFAPALLADLWVRPDLQGRGIGGALIKEALDRCRARGEQQVWIEVHPRNPAARLYTRHGFVLAQETTRRSEGLGRDLPLWVMSQRL